MPRYAYVNGSYRPHSEAAVHIEDRGYQFADGVYEVIAYIDGTLADERGHLDRLARSLDEMKIPMPVPRQTLSILIREVLRKNRVRNAAVYIQVTRGAAKRDFAFPKGDIRPALVITTWAYDYAAGRKKLETGTKAVSVPDIRWRRPDIKTVGLLAQAMARQEAVSRGAHDALFVDEKGYVTEAAASNAWIVQKNGTVVTRPANDHRILKGVTRTAVLTVKDLKFEERPFTLKEAYSAQEVFTSSATSLVVPVVEIDGRKIGTGKPGPVTRRVYDAYLDYVHAGKSR